MRKSDTKRALARTGVRPTKLRGQNFLINESFIDEILNFGCPKPEEQIVEVGPGLGALTAKLSGQEKLTLIEIEPEFCKELQEKYPNAEVINADVRTVDFSKIGSDLVVFGNLPYVYSTEIIFHLLSQRRSIKRAVLLLQKEFAERMAADPGSRAYGVLSIGCQIWAELSLGAIVKGDAFVPPTKVSSRLIELRFLAESKYAIENEEFFKIVVRSAFNQRRKKLLNSLCSTGYFKRPQVDKALNASDIDGNRRAETLSIEEFIRLAAALSAASKA